MEHTPQFFWIGDGGAGSTQFYGQREKQKHKLEQPKHKRRQKQSLRKSSTDQN
jgi:hypothetical protein